MELTVDMILDLSSSQPTLLQNISNFTSSIVNQAIVRPLGDPNLLGVSGFLFDIIDDEEIVCESEITDHVVEANYSIQDHIVLRPIRFSLKGYAGELTESVEQALVNLFQNAVGIKTLNGLLPGFNAQDTQVYSTIASTVQVGINAINSLSNLYQLFQTKSTLATKQQNGFQYFFNLQQSRQLCTVETPFGEFKNMAIERIVALQPGDNRYVSEFTITFKQITTVKSITLATPLNSTSQANQGVNSNYLATASNRVSDMLNADNPTNLGTITGTVSTLSVLESSFTNQVGL